MSDYTIITDFAAKDSLLSGNPAKAGKGSEITAELQAISTAIASKADATNGVLTAPQINDTSANHQYVVAVNELSADRTVTLPLLTGNDEFVFKDHAATLTNKTLTTPVLANPSYSGTTSNGGTVTTIDINGGTIDGAVIGGASAAAGTFTTLTSTGNAALGDAEASDTHAIKGATTLLANSASTALTVTQTGSGNAFVVEDSTSTDSTPFVINSAGIVLHGGATYEGVGSVVPRIFQQWSSGGDPAAGASFVRGTNDTSAPVVIIGKSRSATSGAYVVVQNNDGLGAIRFAGDDGTDLQNYGVQLLAEVDGTPASNAIPGRFIVSTTSSAGVVTERMRIDSAGNVGIGTTAFAGARVVVGGSSTGGTTTYGIDNAQNILSDVTGTWFGFVTFPTTQATAFTLTNAKHFSASQNTIGAGSTVTNQFGFEASSTLTGATNNYGFYSNIASGTGRWNFYAAGTAANYFAGVCQFADGAVGTPSITNIGDENTGLYFPAADQVGVTVGGSNVSTFSSTGLAVTGTGTFSTSSNGFVSSTFENTSTGSSAVNRIQLGNNTSSGAGQIVVYGSNYPTIGNYVDVTNANSSPIRMMIGSTAIGTFSSTGLAVTGIVTPEADNTRTLGTGALRWSVVYAGTGTINTSDAREKTAVRELTADEINAAKQLSKEIGAYRWLSAVEQKGDGAREHIGLTVQRAIEVMQANNLNPFNYGFICYDQWEDVFVEHPAIEAVEAEDATYDEEGNELTPAIEAVEGKAAWTEQTQVAGDRYSFRMDELNLFIARGFEARLAALEAA